jgi:phosphoenolpyruvate-protein phosphotransferase (PTS system enzyme I)
MEIALKETHLIGTPISPGIAIGHLVFSRLSEDAIFEKSIAATDIEQELQRYRRALDLGKRDLEKLQLLFQQSERGEGAAILEAHLQLLNDPVITCEIEQDIRLLQKNAEFVLQKTIHKYKKKFNSIPDAFFRERFYDLQAIVRRILDCLKGKMKSSCEGIKNGVVYNRELSVVDLTEASIGQAQAFITEVNGVTSHAAIAAKAKGIPFITSIVQADLEMVAGNGSIIIVDGNTGDVFIDPSDETFAHYTQKLNSQTATEAFEIPLDAAILPAETYDGYRIRLSANIEMPTEVKSLHSYGVDGVGLFRSEYAFLAHAHFPTQEEQFHIYKEAVDRMNGLPIVIRVFDLGGDKYLLGQMSSSESNPFLGCRAIRLLLREKDLFKDQLKAILRASNYGDVSIMLPMISSLAELLEAKELLHVAHQEAEREFGIPIKGVRVGCMIEVPSAGLITDILAEECDFLSIGTNDLVQYTLAVDRGNHALNNLYTPTHPSVIRLIKLIVCEANCYNIPVSICGEIAANPKFTALLLGLGVHELSVSLRQIGTIKDAIRSTNIVEAVQLADKALTLTSAQEVEELLDESFGVKLK